MSYTDRKSYLKALNAGADELTEILYGSITKARRNQLKRILNRNFNLFIRLTDAERITNKSFRYGYGGRSEFAKTCVQEGILHKRTNEDRTVEYDMVIRMSDIDIPMVIRTITTTFLRVKGIDAEELF